MQKPKAYLIIGNPIAHSLSPMLHQHFAKEYDIGLSYEHCLTTADQFQNTLDQFRTNGGAGANITAPFKQLAYHYAQQLTPQAKQTMAVNTLSFLPNGNCVGHNTDGLGLWHDLHHRLQWPLKKQTILILGAGGAVQGILPTLLDSQPTCITLANRTLSKAQRLAQQFLMNGKIKAISADELNPAKFDLIINATASSLSSRLPEYLDNDCDLSSTRCYDLSYGQADTLFCQWARNNNVHTCASGQGMLVAQAAYAFKYWHGIMPDITNQKSFFLKILADRHIF